MHQNNTIFATTFHTQYKSSYGADAQPDLVETNEHRQ